MSQTVQQQNHKNPKSESKHKMTTGGTRQWTVGTDQLLQVVPDPGKVSERTDGHQAAQSKVKQLVAEKWDEPSITVLKKADTVGKQKIKQ